jgi:hypothetical protein
LTGENNLIGENSLSGENSLGGENSVIVKIVSGENSFWT